MKSTDPEISGAEPADSEPLRIGRALHRYLSIAPLELPLDHTLLSAVCLKESIAVEVVAPLVSNCLASEVCQGAASAHRFWREVPITLDTGEGIMKGVIDLMWQDSQGLSIADYKSGAGSPSSYAPQLAHYAEAVERITGERVVKRWIVTARDGSSFLMPDGELR